MIRTIGRPPIVMLYDPSRHEPLAPVTWNEERARRAIGHIVDDTESCFTSNAFWPIHPRDADNGEVQPFYPLYFGACGVLWALHYLQAVGACELKRSYADCVDSLLPLNREWLDRIQGTAAFPSLDVFFAERQRGGEYKLAEGNDAARSAAQQSTPGGAAAFTPLHIAGLAYARASPAQSDSPSNA